MRCRDFPFVSCGKIFPSSLRLVFCFVVFAFGISVDFLVKWFQLVCFHMHLGKMMNHSSFDFSLVIVL